MEEKPCAVCPSCDDVVTLAEKVMVCPRCEGVYHLRCWRKVGAACSQAACREMLANDLAHLATSHLDAPSQPGGRQPAAVRLSLPVRIHSGAVSDEMLRVQTAGGEREIQWKSIQMLSAGVIQLDLTIETTRSGMQSMLRKLMGEEQTPAPMVRNVRETYLLDLVVNDQEAPFRIDSSSVNYRSLLGSVSYQSMRNFLRLVASIAERATDCRLDSSAMALLTNRRSDIKRYSSVYEFEMELQHCRSNLKDQIARCDIVIPTFEESSVDEETETASREDPPSA